MIEVRNITDAEVEFYREHGWVKLPNLICRADALALLETGKNLIGRLSQKIPPVRPDTPPAEWPTIQTEDCIVGRDPWWTTATKIKGGQFESLRDGRGMGKGAHRLIDRQRLTDREIPTRIVRDSLVCKLPTSDGEADLLFHQDMSNGATDRVGSAVVWLALDDLSPDQGTMSFLDGSHRAGPLGQQSYDAVQCLLDVYPKLPEMYPRLPAIRYGAGDATVHHCLTIHGSARNWTDVARWSYIIDYAPSDCVRPLSSTAVEGKIVFP